MKISIVGTGYVGLVTGVCLAELGNEVLCLDVDEKKIAMLDRGQVPIYEPGLQDLLESNRHSGRLGFTTDPRLSAQFGEIQIIAVGTPPDEDGSADLKYVLAAAQNIGLHMHDFTVVVDKSTVPVGTADRVQAVIAQALASRGVEIPYSVVSNPEFLKEGAAIEDFMRPDRVVIGCADDENGKRARALMAKMYAPFNRNHDRMMVMDVRSAELTKYAANAMLATRISFMNELANLADRIGADIEHVRRGIGSDPRIGYSFLYAGCGYGGSCFPKDVKALVSTAAQVGTSLSLLTAAETANDAQKRVLPAKVCEAYGQDLTGRHFAVWGLAFKPNTDDMRDATSRLVIADLLSRGASVCAYDPVALYEAKRVFSQDLNASDMARLQFSEDRDGVAHDADALIILTEWKEFRSPNLQTLSTRLKRKVIFDGRNLYDPAVMRNEGWSYTTIGRDAVRMSA